MKLPFLNKNNSTSSYSSTSSSSSWPWPSCNQNPKTISFRATITFTNPMHDQDDDELESQEISDSVENVIRGLRSSERLIFESKGETNSILEEATSKGEEEKEEEEEEDEEEGFVYFSLESKDPYSDFKRSMEEMVEANALHHDWKSLEELLLHFLKVNANTSHKYIFAAFVDLLMSLSLDTTKPIINNDIFKDDVVSTSRATTVAGGASTSCCNSMILGESPLSSLSFNYTSCSSSSSSDETSSTSVRFLPLSSLSEMDEKD